MDAHEQYIQNLNQDAHDEACRVEGYNQAVADCLALLAKWFFMSNTNARACRSAMRKLIRK